MRCRIGIHKWAPFISGWVWGILPRHAYKCERCGKVWP